MHPYHLIALVAPWLSLATDFFVARLVLHLGNPKTIGPFRMVSVVALVAGWVSAKMLVVRILPPGSFFLGLHFAYLAIFVLAPVAGLYLLLHKKLELTKHVRIVAVLCVLLAPLGIYVTFVEPFALTNESATVEIAKERAGPAPLRVAVLADIQARTVTDHEREAVRRALAFEPHLILIPGDLLQAWPDEFERAIPEFRELLKPLAAPMGVFFVIGNCDAREPVLRALEGTQVQFLDDRDVVLEHEGWRLRLGGADIRIARRETREFVRAFDTRPDEREVRVLTAHLPDVVYLLTDPSRVDLVVAGHTHGGQVQLPFYGPPITLSSVPRDVAAGGLHSIGGRRIYVSRGVGCERGFAPRMRFLCPPEVSLLTLVAAP
ncbi:MAG: metallophosphoesterase [Planctomycetota bacterium]